MREIKILSVLCLAFFFLIAFQSCQHDVTHKEPILNVAADSLIRSSLAKAFELPREGNGQKDAIQILQDLRKKKLFIQGSDSLKCHTLYRLGHHFYHNDDNHNALLYLDSALIAQKSVDFIDKNVTIAKTHFTKSVVHQNEYNFKLALEEIEKANKILEPYKIYDDKKGVYFSKTAYYYMRLKQASKAKEYFEYAQSLVTPNTPEQATFYNDYAQFHEIEGRHDEGIDYYQKSITVHQTNPILKKSAIAVHFNMLDLVAETKPLAEMNQMYDQFIAELKDTTKALKEYKFLALNSSAFTNYENSNIDKAGINYTKALKVAQEISESEKNVFLSMAYEGLADVEYERGNFKKAIENYHTSVKALSIGFESENLFELPDLEEHAIISDEDLERVIGLKADAIYAKYQEENTLSDLEETYHTYVQLDALLRQMRQGYKAALSRFDLVNRTIPYYEVATNVSLELFEKTSDRKYLQAAYDFASKNKAVVMLDGLQDEKARFSGLSSEMLETESNLKKSIYELESDLFYLNKTGQSNSEEFKKLVNDRFNLTRSYEALVDKFEKEIPRYYNLKYAVNEKVNVAEIQKKLSSDIAIIEYFVGEENIFVFTFSKNRELKCLKIDLDPTLLQQCIQLRQITEKDTESSIIEYVELAYGLYGKILDPVLQTLNDSSVERLIIIPDDVLMNISFETLVTQKVDSSQFKFWTDKLPYLLNDYAVSYAYSNQLLFDNEAQKRISSSRNNYIGFGLEYDDYTLSEISKLSGLFSPSENIRSGMGKLIYSDDEVLECAEIMGGKSFTNEKATKQAFLKTAESADILHLVTHGFVSNDQPLNSGLIFTKQRNEQDFILKARDLYSMELNADLAVLSACHTGDGDLERGEGIRSLARAFNYAGCPSVMASLWAAPDLSSKEIIVEYYKNIKAGKSKDVSLREAKLSYLDNCRFNVDALPSRWAHLINIGDVR